MQREKFYILIFFLFFFSFLYPEGMDEVKKLRQKKQYDQAIESLKSIGDPEAENMMAKIYLDKGDYTSANNLYSKLCGSSSSFDCWNEFGIASIFLKQYERAEEYFQKALSIKNDSVVGLSNLAIAKQALQKYSEAEELYKKAIQLEEFNPIYKINYAVFLVHKKKYYQAKQILQKVIRENSDLFYAELYLAIAHYQSKEYNSALTHLKKGISINPHYYDLYYHRAVVYYRTGDYINALDDLNRMDELYPDNNKSKVLRKMIQNGIR